MTKPFVHLHVHTQYSLLDGAARITDLVKRAKELGQTAIAITDHGVMYGIVDFYRACKKEGIKPILGMEAYVAPHLMSDKSSQADRDNGHLVLLAKNEEGFRNLMELSSEAFIKGYYYKPRIDYSLLERHASGLICLSACLAGDIPQRLLRGRDAEAYELAGRLKGIFGDDYYIELQNHGIPEQLEVLPRLRKLARDLKIKTVATNDIHYVTRSDAEAQDVLLCIQTQRFVDDIDRMRMQAEEFYLKSYDEMLFMLPEDAEALDNSCEIAEKCNVNIEFGVRRLPQFTAPDGRDNTEYLRSLCYRGLSDKLPDGGEEATQRLEYELSIITRMGFVDYYLIVWDFIDFAKRQGIMVGPGRGSGAASLVAYCIGITDVDPIKYKLTFERFLNPERISMPDFDVDFCYERRQEVIDYVGEKYGDGHVAQIITFGTMAARQVIRDVCRVLRVPYADSDRLAKLVPQVLKMTLEDALKVSAELKALYDEDPQVRKVLDLSMKLEGLPRHSSTHAAGVVISGVPLVSVVPLQSNEGVLTTQFPMTTLEELGLLKMDFLGLRTLTVIRDALDFIKAGGKAVPDFSRNDFYDPEVYAMIAAGDTDCVFQLESPGMRNFMMQLKPDCFEDLIAGISLFRPGPMEQIPRYVRGKHDPATIHYEHPLLEPILSTTYGCMVYQEQVMEIVRVLGGYSLGRSDLVRRAMSKKKADVMKQEREYFIHGTDGVDGALKRGVPQEIANRIFDEMMDFASYAFNKAHAAGYAVLAYRTAYLKRYFPVELLTATMNSFITNTDSIAEYVYSARRQGIAVLQPDVNSSLARFSVENGAIRFGLTAVKNVGAAVMADTVRERNINGPFVDFFDFVDRSPGLNKRMLEALICAGCFDGMGCRRSQLLAVFERASDDSASRRKVRDTGQLSFFDLAFEGTAPLPKNTIVLPDLPEMDAHLRLLKEREATGLFLSGHPLDEFTDIIARQRYTVADLAAADGVTGAKDGSQLTVCGMLTQCKQRPNRAGTGMMGYAVLEGITGSVEVVAFTRTLQECGRLFHDESAVLVRGKLSIRDDKVNSLLIDGMSALSGAGHTLYLRLSSLSDEQLRKVRLVVKQYTGTTSIVLVDAVSRRSLKAPDDWNCDCTEALLNELRAAIGSANVILK